MTAPDTALDERTTTQPEGSDLRRPDLAWRALPTVAAVVAALTPAPSYVAGVLVAAALVLAVERLARSRDEGAADALLVTVGGVVVAVVLTGLVLGATPVGLSTTSWAVGLAVVALGALVVAIGRPRPPRAERRTWTLGLHALPWAAAVAAVVVVAVAVSVRSVGPAEAPPLQLSLGTVDGTRAQVEVSSAEPAGPLELRTSDADGNEISYPLFSLDAGQTRTTTVAVPRDGRFSISLTRPDQTQPLRTLVLDR